MSAWLKLFYSGLVLQAEVGREPRQSTAHPKPALPASRARRCWCGFSDSRHAAPDPRLLRQRWKLLQRPWSSAIPCW